MTPSDNLFWSDLALVRMPSLRKLIRKNKTPMGLWIDLAFRLDSAYEEHDQQLIHQIYGYAHWSYFEAEDEELEQAVGCAFYEHLPLNPVVKRDLPNWLTREEFKALSTVLHYHQSDEEFEELCQSFDLHTAGVSST